MSDTTLEAPSKQRLRLWLRLLRASRMIENDVRELLRREFATTLPRFDVMAALYRAHTEMTMGALSRELMVSGGNVTGIVDRLVDDKLVYRTHDRNDRRTIYVELSTEGRMAFETMAAAHEAWISRRLCELDEQQADAAIEILKDIEQSVERHGR